MESILTRFFRFFASVQLAVILLLTLGGILAVGTFIESAHGAKAAQILIYHTKWFSVILVILAVNLVTSTLTRLPWKVKHIGFVATHAGILMILAGSLITQRFAVDGMMAITEGNEENRVMLGQSVIEVMSPTLGLHEVINLKPRAFDWKGQELLHRSDKNNLNLHLVAFYPKAKAEEQIKPADEGPAALHIQLQGSFVKGSYWLMADEPGHDTIDLGMAAIRFTRQALSNPTQSEPYIEFQFPGKRFDVLLSHAQNEFFKLEGTPYKVKIEKTFLDAGVEGNQLIERSAQANNPALQMTLEGTDWTEFHTLFAKYPEFPTMHGLKESQTAVKIIYHYPSVSRERFELRFVSQSEVVGARHASPLPLAQIQSGSGFEQITDLVFDKNYPTGWNDIQFRIETYYPHARIEKNYTPLAVNTEEAGAATAIQLALTQGDQSLLFWIQEGDSVPVNVGTAQMHIAFGRRTLPLGFSLALKDFRVQTYPGTQQPQSFESDAILKDPANKVERTQTISMNEPLEYQGFKIYQSGYELGQGGPDLSVFSVGRDPGIPLKYAGSIVLVLGTVIFFFTKKFSTSKPLEVASPLPPP